LARFRTAAQALYRLRARPVTAISKRINALERELPALEACGLNVLVQDLLEQMMHWHFVLLAAFFMESQPTARPIMILIVDFEFQYRAHSGERAEHCGDQRPVRSGHRIL
jgi:hypothetical protein